MMSDWKERTRCDVSSLLHMGRHQPKPWTDPAKIEADEHAARQLKLISLMFYWISMSWNSHQCTGTTEWEDEDGVTLSALRKRILEDIAK